MNKIVIFAKNRGDEPLVNKKEETFSALYATNQEFFGNGVQSYITAYRIDLDEPDAYNKAIAQAHKLLKRSNILARINFFLESLDLNPAHVDKQLAFVITQNANLPAKMDAVKTALKMQGRLQENNQTIIINQMAEREMDVDIARLTREIEEGKIAKASQEETSEPELAGEQT